MDNPTANPQENVPYPDLETLRVGQKMSNFLFNLTQFDQVPENFRKMAFSLQQEWDTVIAGQIAEALGLMSPDVKLGNMK